jgi:predicted DNA-binding transcriptional regulator YafY
MVKEVHMKAESNSKIRLLRLWEILKQETDEEHPMGTSEIITRLRKEGLKCVRQTIYDDIRLLNENGYEVLCNTSKSNEYYVVNRSFDVPEIQILIDAVQAASFITEKKTTVLVDKIAQLAGTQKGKVLKRNIVQYSTVKGKNEGIYYSVNEITTAITTKKKIGFYYFDRDTHNKPVYRKSKDNPIENRWYIVNPVSTIFHDDKYYLFCYDDKHGKLVQYRVDRMDQVKMLEDPITPNSEVSAEELVKHSKSLINMYNGREETVTFVADKSVIGAIYDKFGDQTRLFDLGDDKVRFAVKVQIGNPFLAWVIGFGNKMKVVEPNSVVEDINKLLLETVENYKGAN